MPGRLSRAMSALAAMGLAASLGCQRKAAEAPLVPVVFPDGYTVYAEVASTESARARGLMNRRDLSRDRGMLFVLGRETPAVFWMKDVYMALDILFLDAEQRVRYLYERVPAAPPSTPEDRIPRVKGWGMYVLELMAGTSRMHQVSVGDRLLFDLPDSLEPPAQPPVRDYTPPKQ